MKVFKKYIPAIVLGLMLLSNSLFAQTIAADAIIGNYQTESGSAKVQVYKQNNQYFGKVTWAQAKLSPGTILLKNLTYNQKSWDGTVYAPARDKDFDCTITLPDTKTLKLQVKAGIISVVQVWTRIE